MSASIVDTEGTEENAQQECSATNDTTADELFYSFMEIANDPVIQTGHQMGGALDQSESLDPQCTLQVDEPETLEDGIAGPCNLSSQGKDKIMQNSRFGEKEIFPLIDGSESFTLGHQGTSDDDPMQSTTTESMEQETANPAIKTEKPGEVCATGASSLLSPDVERIGEQTFESEVLEKISEDKDNKAEDGKGILVDGNDHSIKSNASLAHQEDSFTRDTSNLLNGQDQETSKRDLGNRLSKVMEDLAGLEKLLSTAVSEFKAPTSCERLEEECEGEDVIVSVKEDEQCQEVNKGLDQGNPIMDAKEKNELNNAELQYSEVLVYDGANISVCETGKEQAKYAEIRSQEDLLNAPSAVNLIKEGTVTKSNECADNYLASELQDDRKSLEEEETLNTPLILGKEKEEASELKDGRSSVEMGEKDGQSDKDCQAEISVLEVHEPAEAQGKACSGLQKLQTTAHELPEETAIEQVQTTAHELPKETAAEQLNIAENAVEQSGSVDELDNEVTSPCATAPDIEVTLTDESGILERNSLDSLDTEESSNSRPTSPAPSDEGIDSDAQSDYGDHDDSSFDPDNLNTSATCPRKSWLLETDRDRLSSDSSTVSEVDFKDHYAKRDNTDGTSSCKDYIRGHLLKLGGTGLTPKNWRKRWFVLRGDNCLYYYKSSRDKEPCGVIILSNYSVSKAPEINKSHCFKLTKGGARTYHMCAGSETDMKKWMVAMMDAVKESAKQANPFNILEGNVHNVSIPALSIRDPDCHGYLYKEGHNYKIWRKRYFVLKNGFLYYYMDMSNTVALGVAKLLHYAVSKGEQSGKKFCFSAVSPDKSSRSYHFATESDMDRTRWLSRLEESIKKGSSGH